MFDILGSLLNNSFSSASSFVAPIKLVALSDHNVLGFPRMLINRVNAAMNAAAERMSALVEKQTKIEIKHLWGGLFRASAL